MATWTYFTSYLDGSRPITKAERNELLDNFKAAVDACSGGYGVDATLLAAIKASDVITDRMQVTGPSGLSGSLSAGIVFVPTWSPAGADVLEQAALDEGLTATEYNDLFDVSAYRNRKTEIDDYRIWNILKRAIDALSCCNDDAPTLVCRTASASKTKCGFDEFGTPSSPPKKYLTKAQSGGLTDTFDAGGPDEVTYQNVWSGAISYSRPGCTATDTRQLAITSTYGANSENCTATNVVTGANGRADTATGSDLLGSFLWGTDCAGTARDPLQGCEAETIVSTTGKTYATASCTSFTGGSVTGSTVTVTLSDEYTTTLLLADVDAALPAFSGSFAACSSTALYDLSSDELTATKRAMEYKFTLPSLYPGQCYRIEWIERFTPEGGGSAVDTPKTYDWDGVATETPVFTINPPSTQGSVSIVSIVASCTCP